MLLHGKRINTVDCAPQQESNAHTFVTSSSDASVKIWDARLMRPRSTKAPMLKPVAEMHHTGTCHGMLVSPLAIITIVVHPIVVFEFIPCLPRQVHSTDCCTWG